MGSSLSQVPRPPCQRPVWAWAQEAEVAAAQVQGGGASLGHGGQDARGFADQTRTALRSGGLEKRPRRIDVTPS